MTMKNNGVNTPGAERISLSNTFTVIISLLHSKTPWDQPREFVYLFLIFFHMILPIISNAIPRIVHPEISNIPGKAVIISLIHENIASITWLRVSKK